MAKNSDEKMIRGAIIPGTIMVALGIIFLLNNYGYTTFDFSKIWPIFLIVPGLLMIFGVHRKKY